jgi:protein-tyrosine phosphatase
MRVGTSFVIIGLGLLAAAAVMFLQTNEPLCWALAWPASSFVTVGLAYLGLGPGLLGKTKAGRMPWSRVLALLPFFALTWSAWHLLRLRPGPAFHLAAPRLYIGRRPVGGELPKDVRWVVDLTAEFSLGVEIHPDMKYETLPILDGHVPTEPALLDLAKRITEHPDTVYVHCAQGHGRAALVTSAVLVARGLSSGVADAERRLMALRPGVHLTQSQRSLLQRVEARLQGMSETPSSGT